MARSAVVAIAAFLLLTAAIACRPASGSARAAAEAFLDAQYVRIDLQDSLRRTDGPASRKVREEIRLTEGLDAPAEEHKPRIHYRLRRSQPSGDGAAGNDMTFVYRLTISPQGSEAFTRDVILTVRKRGDRFRVTNYMEK